MDTTNSTRALRHLNNLFTTVSTLYHRLYIFGSLLIDCSPQVQGQLTQATARSDLVGPVNGADYTYRDEFDLVSTVTSPCGVSSVMNIQSDLRTSNSANPKGAGYIATDSVRIVHVYGTNLMLIFEI